MALTNFMSRMRQPRKAVKKVAARSARVGRNHEEEHRLPMWNLPKAVWSYGMW